MPCHAHHPGLTSRHAKKSSSIIADTAEIRAHDPIDAAPEPPIPSIPLLVPPPVLGQDGAVSDPVLASIHGFVAAGAGAGAGDEPGEDGDAAQDAGWEGGLREEGFGDGPQHGFAHAGDCGHVCSG